ncbi:MAG: cell division protein FtsX [Gammaproteobacteria bacterium]|nr:cell division protein FtsX [Gammaproteobacteria bacterium]
MFWGKRSRRGATKSRPFSVKFKKFFASLISQTNARPKRQPRPARQHSRLIVKVENYLQLHLATLVDSFAQLSLKPLTTLMTAAVIGISLSLPALLQLVLDNGKAVVSGWDESTNITLYIRDSVSNTQIEALSQSLQLATIKAVHYISREEALAEFRQLSGFSAALDMLENNPLPAVLVITPATAQGDAAALEALRQQLSSLPEVELAQLDMAWVERLFALIHLGDRALWILSLLLAFAVLLIVGNTIRLAILNRREEIVISKLIGATDGFIRRPFLYTGFWYGLFGGLIAALLTEIAVWSLTAPLEHFTGLYESDFTISGLSLSALLEILCFSSLLGLVGSAIAVGRHLKAIEPT